MEFFYVVNRNATGIVFTLNDNDECRFNPGMSVWIFPIFFYSNVKDNIGFSVLGIIAFLFMYFYMGIRQYETVGFYKITDNLVDLIFQC